MLFQVAKGFKDLAPMDSFFLGDVREFSALRNYPETFSPPRPV